jgi:hypothetical protein
VIEICSQNLFRIVSLQPIQKKEENTENTLVGGEDDEEDNDEDRLLARSVTTCPLCST